MTDAAAPPAALASALHQVGALAQRIATRLLAAGHAPQRSAAEGPLLAALAEREGLLERLSRIQRSISARQPLREVIEAVVTGAAELLGDEIVGLRLIDDLDPTVMHLVSAYGVPTDVVTVNKDQPVGAGLGGRAIAENALVLTDDYASLTPPLPGYVEDGVRSAMAAPVRRGGQPVGSLVVATRRAGRTYSASEQEVLTAFAEHAGLALNDAHAVADLRRAVAEAVHLSRHDMLTGLPNRVLLLERLQELSAGSGAEPVALLFVDLDDFKLVNDSLGHLVGDELLRAVGGRIGRGLRGEDVLARLGGDEFAVVMPATRPGEAAGVASRVLALLGEPFTIDDHVVHVRASIGLVVAEGQVTSEGLLRDADVAMYRAKAEGGHRFVLFEQHMREVLQARAELQAELRTALSLSQLQLHYQPVVDAERGTVCGVEALLRWDHPRLGLVGPDEFVPLAEDNGLIVQIGTQVLRTACAQAVRWRRTPELADLTLSVNLSPRQLREASIVEDVRTALRLSGLPPDSLVLEITERLLVDDVVTATSRLAALKATGVRLAVDDFGTGYSSLSYLSRLPVDLLKVDRSFVAAMEELTGGRLARAVLALGGSLGLTTVAEGVETPEQARALVAHGCTRLQGFLYSPAVPAEALPAVARAIAARQASTGQDGPATHG